MSILTRTDILKAIRIRKLVTKANDPAATPAEADAYAAKALLLMSRYRNGKAMKLS